MLFHSANIKNVTTWKTTQCINTWINKLWKIQGQKKCILMQISKIFIIIIRSATGYVGYVYTFRSVNITYKDGPVSKLFLYK